MCNIHLSGSVGVASIEFHYLQACFFYNNFANISMIQQQSYRIITKGIRKYSIGFSSDVPDDLVCWILSQPCMIDYCETMVRLCNCMNCNT